MSTREVLAWSIRDGETEQAWTELFGDLKRRGVAGESKLVLSDGHEGIRAPLRAFIPKPRGSDAGRILRATP